jgi:hypothetical protein
MTELQWGCVGGEESSGEFAIIGDVVALPVLVVLVGMVRSPLLWVVTAIGCGAGALTAQQSPRSFCFGEDVGGCLQQ